MEFNKGCAYVGLGDVVGGQMWHCIKSINDLSAVWFYYKRECAKYIRDNFEGSDKTFLLSQLNSCKGKTWIKML